MSVDAATEDDEDNVAGEEDEDYVAAEDDEDYVAAEEEEDDEYGYLSGNSATDYDDDELESMIHLSLLKVPAADYKDLPPEESDYMFKPRKGEESKVEEESKEDDDGDVEEESKVPKTNDGIQTKGDLLLEKKQ